MSTDLYGMKMLEILDNEKENTKIVRVPGGWVFAFYDTGKVVTNSQFVPWDFIAEEKPVKSVKVPDADKDWNA